MGPSDRDVISELIRKLGYHGAIYSRIVEQGKVYDAEYMLRHISQLIRDRADISKIIVFPDSECTPIPESKERADSVIRKLARKLHKLPIKYVIVDHSLEGWLLQDEEALKSVIGTGSALSLSTNPEDDCRPADTIRNLFKKHGKSFRKTIDDKKIAGMIDVKLLESRSDTFAQLVSVLRSSNR